MSLLLSLLPLPFFSTADLNAQDHKGFTALMWAAQMNHLWTAKALLTGKEPGAKADLNAKGTAGNTALMNAAQEGHHKVGDG